MVNEASDAQRWEQAVRVAQAEQLRAITLRLSGEIAGARIEKRRARLQLIRLKVSRAAKWLFVSHPRICILQLRLLRLRFEYFTINCRLAGYKLYDRFTGHSSFPVQVVNETANDQVQARRQASPGAQS